MADTVSEFSEIQDSFLDHIRDIEYATMAPVDRRRRRRARVLLRRSSTPRPWLSWTSGVTPLAR